MKNPTNVQQNTQVIKNCITPKMTVSRLPPSNPAPTFPSPPVKTLTISHKMAWVCGMMGTSLLPRV